MNEVIILAKFSARVYDVKKTQRKKPCVFYKIAGNYRFIAGNLHLPIILLSSNQFIKLHKGMHDLNIAKTFYLPTARSAGC